MGKKDLHVSYGQPLEMHGLPLRNLVNREACYRLYVRYEPCRKFTAR